MMSIENATPRPWKKNNTYGWLEGANGNLVSTYDLGLSAALAGPSEEERANAKLIATAVNAHDQLVEALEMVRDADEDCKRDGLATIPPTARAKIDAALKLARTKS